MRISGPNTKKRALRLPWVVMATVVAFAWAGCPTALGQPAAAPRAGEDAEFDMAGVQMWNIDYWQTPVHADFYATNYKMKELKPITLVGARNGTFSGCVILTNSNGPLRGLKVKASDLAQEGEGKDGKIPAAQVRVRYAEPGQPSKSWCPAYRYDGLLDEPPDEVPTVEMKDVRGFKQKHEGPLAMQPVWVTVKVPKDAAGGDYQGKLSIDVESPALKPMEVGIRLTVHDWAVPDPKDFAIQNLGWLSPEVEARHYKVEMWSDKHIELMAKAFALMLELGSRQVQVNLVTRYPSQDNAETMIKWIKQPDGTFKCDFAAFDKYMDMVAKVVGKPLPVRLNMWCYKMKDPPSPRVVVVDPATGKREEMDQPEVGSPESYAFWKPVLDGIRMRMDKRGWFDVTGANWHEYCGGPTPAAVSMLKKIWPDGKWTDMDHGRRWPVFAGTEPGDAMPILTTTTVWNEGDCRPRGYKVGLKPGVAICGHARDRHREWSPLWDDRAIVEEQIMKGNHGVDPLGGDLWPQDDGRGHIYIGAWAACALGPGNCTKAFLAPGPNGAIATERFEAFREGVQIAEAILFVQKGLDSGKLNAPLAAKANKVLDDRSNVMLAAWPKIDDYGHRRFVAATFAKDAQQREGDLFAVAGEIAKALAPARNTTQPE